MECLGHTMIWDWCRRNGYALDESVSGVAPRLARDPSMTGGGPMVHDAAGNPAAASALASTLLGQLGAWDSCLLWVTESDVWWDREDWPRFYAWRASYDEKRSLGAAPGHVFEPSEKRDLLKLLSHTIECGWDVVVLPVSDSQPTGIRLGTSHDEWIEFTRREGLKPG